MLKHLFPFFVCVSLSVSCFSQVKVLFDAKKGEMAGNADWVIDFDVNNLRIGSSGVSLSTPGRQSNAQRIPTPPQSGITASTPETYWTGGISAWAVDCAKRGYVVESLPWDGTISYGDTSNAQDLSNYDVYVIDEPNITFTTAEKAAIVQFVYNGGGLFAVANHSGADRNGDGYDSREVWNDLLANNTVQPYPFGFTFDSADFSGTYYNIRATTTDSLIHGPMGDITRMKFASGTTMTLDTLRNNTVKGLIYKSSSAASNEQVMVAYSRFGRGRVVALGDSSPTDDSTGNNDVCTLYNGYFADASGDHRKLIMNATIWLAQLYPTSLADLTSDITPIQVYPNPNKGELNIAFNDGGETTEMMIIDVAGKLIMKLLWTAGTVEQKLTLEGGIYIIKAQNSKGVSIAKVVVSR